MRGCSSVQVRVYRFATGKLYRVFDETLHMYAELQQVSTVLLALLSKLLPVCMFEASWLLLAVNQNIYRCANAPQFLAASQWNICNLCTSNYSMPFVSLSLTVYIVLCCMPRPILFCLAWTMAVALLWNGNWRKLDFCILSVAVRGLHFHFVNLSCVVYCVFHLFQLVVFNDIMACKVFDSSIA